MGDSAGESEAGALPRGSFVWNCAAASDMPCVAVAVFTAMSGVPGDVVGKGRDAEAVMPEASVFKISAPELSIPEAERNTGPSTRWATSTGVPGLSLGARRSISARSMAMQPCVLWVAMGRPLL